MPERSISRSVFHPGANEIKGVPRSGSARLSDHALEVERDCRCQAH